MKDGYLTVEEAVKTIKEAMAGESKTLDESPNATQLTDSKLRNSQI